MCEVLNNREIATVFWVIILALLLVQNAKIRTSVADLLRSFFRWKILLCLVAMLLYTSAVISALRIMGMWNISMLKETILWYFTAFGLVIYYTLSNQDEYIFRSVFRDSFKLIILIEFLIGRYVMPLLAELIFIPFATCLAVMDAYLSVHEGSAHLRTLIRLLFAACGLVILGFAAWSAIADYRSLGTLETAWEICFPPFMSIALVPLIYISALVATYENIFLRLRFLRNLPPDLVTYAKRRIVLHHHLSLHRLRRFSRNLSAELLAVQSRADIDNLMNAH